MKKVLNKILSVLMVFVVMFTTMSFVIDIHYCEDFLVDFSLFHNAETCGMENQHLGKGFSENPCSDEQIVIDGQDDLKTFYNKLTFEQQAFVATFFYTYINLFDGLDKNIIPFRYYTPPYLIKDVQELHETYLI